MITPSSAGLTAVHQFCRIGRFAITGGCSKIVQDVPPFMIADGNPARSPRDQPGRLGTSRLSAEKIKPIKEAFRLIYRGKLNTAQALEACARKLGSSEDVQRDHAIHRRRASEASFVKAARSSA